MPISDRDIDVINGALTLAIFRASVAGNDEAKEIFKDVAMRVAAELERRKVGPFSLAEARDSGKWYRRIGDQRWRCEIDGVMHSKGDGPGARPMPLPGSELVTIADAAAGDWEVQP